MNIFLTPNPKKIIYKSDRYSFKEKGSISIDNLGLFSAVSIAKKSAFNNYKVLVNSDADIAFKYKPDIEKEGYELSIDADGVTILYTDFSGAFYGFMTLNQIKEQYSCVDCLEIVDAPDFPIRGYMWDVARCKIPKLSTVFEMIDILASFKINHLELYMEGAPFEYESHPYMWAGTEVLTGEEIMQIDRYCKERFIDLVPTHNTFGHMGAWLEKLPRDMAICPDGFYYEPWKTRFNKPASLNPFNPKSIELVMEISDDLLKYFSSDNFNVCCDEVLELGCGLTEGFSKYELGKTYFDFLMLIYNYCKEKGKKMFFWGDIIIKHPEFIKELPDNIVALNWGYEPYDPSEESCIEFEKAGIDYCVCPGTGTWKTFTGKTRQMIENINGAALKGLSHNASGLILTDWGDCGHLQGFATVFAGIAYASAVSWGYHENVDLDIAKALDKFIFRSSGVGEFALKVGMYHKMEPMHLINQTVSEKLLFNPIENLELSEIPCLWECISHEKLDSIIAHMNECKRELMSLDFSRIADGENIRDEYAVGIKTVILAQYIGHYKLYLHENNLSEQKNTLELIIKTLPEIIGEFRRTWIVKNKYSRLDDALTQLKNKLEQAKECYSKF